MGSSLKMTTRSGSINPKTGGSIKVKNDTRKMIAGEIELIEGCRLINDIRFAILRD